MTLTGLCNTFCGNITTTLQYHRKNIISFTITKRYTEKVEKHVFQPKKQINFIFFTFFVRNIFFYSDLFFFSFFNRS